MLAGHSAGVETYEAAGVYAARLEVEEVEEVEEVVVEVVVDRPEVRDEEEIVELVYTTGDGEEGILLGLLAYAPDTDELMKVEVLLELTA